jgi:hypothetical protein
MSVDKMLHEMVAEKMAEALAPVFAALEELRSTNSVVERLSAALGQPVKRGPGRPRKVPAPTMASASNAAVKGKRGRKPSGKLMCAVMGCGRPARSKGYCAAHYQKFRMLDRTGRLPSDWVADASPNSVKNVKLPRGRAGAKALAESRKR